MTDDTGFDIGTIVVEDAAPSEQWVDEGDISAPGAPSSRDTAGSGRPRPRRVRDRNKTTEALPVPPKPLKGSLVRPLTDMYVSVGMMIVPFDQVCGTSVVNSAQQCAEALENAARENPALRRIILRMVETSVWGQLIAAHAPIAMTIAAHHNPRMRDAFNGVTPPTSESNTFNPESNGHV